MGTVHRPAPSIEARHVTGEDLAYMLDVLHLRGGQFPGTPYELVKSVLPTELLDLERALGPRAAWWRSRFVRRLLSAVWVLQRAGLVTIDKQGVRRVAA